MHTIEESLFFITILDNLYSFIILLIFSAWNENEKDFDKNQSWDEQKTW